MSDHAVTDTARRADLRAAEGRALSLLDAIEAKGLIAPGRTERAVEQDIVALAQSDFGVETHWHKRIVRAGANTLAIFSDNPPVLTIAEDDIVFVDLGPVFGAWEADVGRSYALGGDPEKRRLCADLPRLFDKLQAEFRARPDITGADLYAFACDAAAQAGWRFVGAIAGHIVGPFPHARVPGEKELQRIAPGNPRPLSDPDSLGHARHWIIEIHIAAPDGRFAGFYERLA
jgi:Xaa-Pro aminopeptidase